MANGFGSVHKIGGNKKRRNPYRARVTDRWEYDEEKGRAVQKFRTIGYYPNRREALLALADYNKAPIAKGTGDITFGDVFASWSERKFPEISPKLQEAYKSSFRKSAPLHKMKMADIKAEHLEEIMFGLSSGYATQYRVKSLWNQIFDYAVKHDIIQKNYSKFISTKDKGSSGGSKDPLSRETVQALWEHVDSVPGVDTVLIMIYTGMRPAEMLTIKRENIHLAERYMVGGIKTKAGIDRVIPIHERIAPLVERVYLGERVLYKEGETSHNAYLRYNRGTWRKIRDQGLLENATPHCCRHTAVTLLSEAGVDIRTIKKIVGHSSSDVTERYTKQSLSFLLESINKLD